MYLIQTDFKTKQFSRHQKMKNKQTTTYFLFLLHFSSYLQVTCLITCTWSHIHVSASGPKIYLNEKSHKMSFYYANLLTMDINI